ncbi:MAG: ion transporter [Phycisphaerae bacterium]|nr:ion transporter [Phycisphaerae bacterium]
MLLLLLSVYVIIEMIVELFTKFSPDTLILLEYIDNIACGIFLVDFIYNAIRYKRKYLKWGWIDFISSIPMIDGLRIGRVARVIRIVRLFRAFKSTKSAVSSIFENKASGAFGTVAMISIFMLIFTSIAILHVEKGTNANINTPSDALWWSFVTITTVGYGDYYPVTTEGRVIASLLMLTGVGLFGTFTGFVASWFIEDEEEIQSEELGHIKEQLLEIKQALAELKK